MVDEKLFLNLLNRALDISSNAYVPYSQFQVGCAILLDNGQIIEGVNIENASYPVSLCAERAAMAYVVTHGLQDQIKAIAIAAKTSMPCSPCGMCRQFLSEFLKQKIPIILGNHEQKMWILTMSELLPFAFDQKSLKS
jgi:cytidine deaminase